MSEPDPHRPPPEQPPPRDQPPARVDPHPGYAPQHPLARGRDAGLSTALRALGVIIVVTVVAVVLAALLE